MTATFQPGQRVRHKTKNLMGTVVSRDEPIEGTAQISAPNVTYTVQWDDQPQSESMVYPNELEAV